jgi:hypothetical protein
MDTRCRLTRQTGHLSRIGIMAPCKEQIAALLITIPKTNYGAAHIKAIEFHDPKGHAQEFLYYPNGSVRNAFSLRPR